MQRSPAENRMARQVRVTGSGAETPEQFRARVNRNWDEIKQARNIAQNQNNPVALKVLDAELQSRRGIDFPADAAWDDGDGFEAEDDGFVADDGFQPDGPPVRASQADVRRADHLSPLAEQEADERIFDEARRQWLKKHGGLAIHPNERELVQAETGLRDPRTTRRSAEIAEMVETDEYVPNENLAYEVAKIAASMGGFATMGPLGATAAEALVRYININANLDRAVKAGMDPERADELRTSELKKGVALDALFNFGVPILGRLSTKIPGVQSALDSINKYLGRQTPSPLDVKRDERAKLAPDAVSREAAEQLQKRMPDDFVLRPGQIKGEDSPSESLLKRTYPHTFIPQERAAQDAAEQLLRDRIEPPTTLGRETLGETIQKMSEDMIATMKTRLRPVFNAADNIGVTVDMRPVRQIAARAMTAAQRVPGGGLDPKEMALLDGIFESLRRNGEVGPEYALDFMSRQKEQLRNATNDWTPSQKFEITVNQMIAATETAYQRAAKFADPMIGKELLRARKEYATAMETVYEDAIKQALRKEPAQVGKLLWQPGNVARVRQLRDLLILSEREGVIGKTGADQIRMDIVRGFLQQGVRDVDTAAKWSQTLRQNVEMRDTWNMLTANPLGRRLDHTMKVVEKAAQMSLHSDSKKHTVFGSIAAGRAAQGTLGISLVTGALHPAMAAAGLSIAGLMKMASTAHVRGEKGGLNAINRLLRTNSAGTAASAKAMQELLPEFIKLAKEYGVSEEELFVPMGEQSEQPEQR